MEGSSTHSTTSLSFSSKDATTDTYRTFIEQLRQQLSVGADRKSSSVPVLRQSVPDSERFILINLINSAQETIILAIDVVDVRVVAYLRDKECYSYFFPDAPVLAFQSLFSQTHKSILNFSSPYEYIEAAAGITRSKTPLGLTSLDSAIGNLFHYRYELVPVSFLVTIQMISDASKFRFIEQSVRNSIRDGMEFTPSLAVLSLEDNWSTLSAHIQGSSKLQGLFSNPIKLFNSKDETIAVDSIYYPYIIPNIALQIRKCYFGKRSAINDLIHHNDLIDDGTIRKPGDCDGDRDDDGGDDGNRHNDPCAVLERTTQISGRNGLCAAVKNNENDNGSPIILYECGKKESQNWKFQRDGTIQSLGKCMTLMEKNSAIVIYNCSLVETKTTKWELQTDGTIINPSSGNGLISLTAEADKSGTPLTANPRTYITGQGWRTGDNVNPIVVSIMGFKDMCLEAIACSEYSLIWMEKCVKEKKDQEWAIYSDGTIRVNSKRNLCVTAFGAGKQDDVIILLDCRGTANQRWVFKPDSSIYNPISGLVMDVRGGYISFHQIILYAFQDKPNQKWLPFY